MGKNERSVVGGAGLLVTYFLTFASVLSHEHGKSTAISRNLKSNSDPPKVFILGVQKGGSSSMMVMLTMHPQLCSGQWKETHFFAGHYDNQLEKGTKWKDLRNEYLSYFTDEKCLGKAGSSFIDGTPVMHQSEAASRNIADFYEKMGNKDDIKMIVMLREPVSRDFSWYQHYTRKFLSGYHSERKGYRATGKGAFKDLKTFKELWAAEIAAVKAGLKERKSIPSDIAGDYAGQLKDFMRYFRRDQILVLNSQMVFTQTAAAMEAVRTFLGVKAFSKWDTEPFPHEGHIEMAEDATDPECIYRHVPPLDCDFRDALAEHYSGSNKELEQWMKSTKGYAHPAEPDFESFRSEYKNVSCVPDARAYYNEVLANDTATTC
jgi:Sulfotransferase domain